MARDRNDPGRRRSSIDGRGPGVDLFDDPPWNPDRDDGDTRRTWLRRLGFVVFISFLGFLGAALVLLAIALVAAVTHFTFGLGPLDLNITEPPPSSYGMDIALSPDGSVAYVTEPAAGTLLVLATATGRLLATVPVGEDPSGLALSPDGTQVWVVNTAINSSPTDSGTTTDATEESVSVIATATDDVMATIPVGSGPIDVAFSPDGRQAYITDNGAFLPGSVSVIDTATLAVVGTLSLPAPVGTSGSNPTSVAVTPDGQVWVSAVNDLNPSNTPDDIYVFNPVSLTPVATIAVGTGPFFMVLSHDGRYAYVADKESCDLRQIDTTTHRVVATVAWPRADGCPFGLADGPNDDVVYTVTGNDHTINLGDRGSVFGAVDFGTSRIIVHHQVGSDPVTLALSPNGWAAYVVDADRPVVEVVDPATGATVSTLSLPS